ncbi:MAG: class I SAM-dependent methyltransferase [Candidatus Gracilibacteria bacterium]|nr:class I SAM-dependent methyltransferase [Candidatus Gracilibacteria bacterium]
MNKIFSKLFFQVNRLFFHKHHPFHDLKNGINDLNYTDFEYSHCRQMLEQYQGFINLEELRNKKILEIGCGGGGKIIYISEKYNCEAIGVDIHLGFLDQAIKKAEEKNVSDKVTFQEQNALSLDFYENSFDFILMSDVLEHIPETRKLIHEVTRVLKPGGKILFDFAPYYHYFGHHLWDTIQIPWLHLFTTESCRIALYKKSVEGFPDAQKRIDLRIGKQNNGTETFSYLNKITRKQFESIIFECEDKKMFDKCTISYFMLKNITTLGRIPFLREMFIRHIVGVIRK